MSGQLESMHFLKRGDQVRHTDGRVGTVADALTLYAVVRWEGGAEQEVEQLDPRIMVVERAAGA